MRLRSTSRRRRPRKTSAVDAGAGEVGVAYNLRDRFSRLPDVVL